MIFEPRAFRRDGGQSLQSPCLLRPALPSWRASITSIAAPLEALCPGHVVLCRRRALAGALGYTQRQFQRSVKRIIRAAQDVDEPHGTTMPSSWPQMEEEILPFDLLTSLNRSGHSPWQWLAMSESNGGEAGIRTLGRAFRPYNGLANRRLQPLGHLTAPRRAGTSKYTTRQAPLVGAWAVSDFLEPTGGVLVQEA
jgi:hypothetical protein